MNNVNTLLSGISLIGNELIPIINPYENNQIGNISIINSLSSEQKAELSSPSSVDLLILLSCISSFRKIISDHAQEIIELAAQETGSPIKYQKMDMDSVFEYLDSLHLLKDLENESFKYEPKGRCLIITSANQPIILVTFTIVTALLYGNKVALRPSSRAPLTAYKIVELLHQSGISKENLNILTSSKELTHELISEGSFEAVISFASNAVNKILGQTCVNSGIEFYAENEGYDWIYVDKDLPERLGDIGRQIISGIVKHNGQMCDSVRGIIIHSHIYEELKSVLLELLDKVIIANPLDAEAEIGSLLANTENQAEKYAALVHLKSKLIGEKGPIKLFEVTQFDTEVYKQAPFAPIAWIREFNGHMDEIIKLWNKTNPYGLGFSIYSSNKDTQTYLIQNIKAGRININQEHTEVDSFSPWGGIRNSGYGGPHYWFERFTNRKYINYGK